MSDFIRREVSKHERFVIAYEGLVSSLTDGYDMSIYEYANDISCRQRLEDERSEPGARELWQRVELADSRLREILRPTKCCIHGSYPPECFWYWGYPPNSPELEADLRTIGAL